MARTDYQFGSLELRGDVWSLVYRVARTDGKRHKKRERVGTLGKYPTAAAANKAAEAIRARINGQTPSPKAIKFEGLVERYIADERLREIVASPPGEIRTNGVRYSTAVAYLSLLENRIRPKWDDFPLSEVRPAAVQAWLWDLDLAPKTKGHLRAFMHRLFEKAMLWELVPFQRNPMQLVEIRGISKRRKKPLVLTPEHFWAIADALTEPYRQMVIVAQFLGLRVSEIVVLKWSDFDFDHLTVKVQRAAVHGRIDQLKTEYSEDELPLASEFAVILLDWRERCPATAGDWVFPSHLTGEPYHASPIQQDYIRPAGEKIGLGRVGWHTFRHTFRSWLDDAGAPLGVQQKLMRHAQISTTMNVYGNALMESKRRAQAKVVEIGMQRAVPNCPQTAVEMVN